MSASLGQAWIDLVERILREGTPMSSEGLELLGANVAFPVNSQIDPILAALADQRMIAEMKKVFFTDSANSLGHSYAKLLRGPGGRHDLQDVITLLKAEPATKRALVNFLSEPGGKVPCISAVQFLIREQALQVIYFARGQDAFRKFYADALCLVGMGETVAKALGAGPGIVRGFIGSSHVYHHDLPEIQQALAKAGALTGAREQEALA